ncbi:MAG: hypothetical protein ABIS27_04235, partial [Longimicrobiales bacterium]
MKVFPVVLGLIVLGVLSPANVASAQRKPAGTAPVRVFLDCNTSGCDFDYLRTEIPYVNYVRDRTDAELHVLVTSQPTGGGGRELTFNFIGLRDFMGVSDTLTTVLPQEATQDDQRKGIARTLKLGLVRYLAR